MHPSLDSGEKTRLERQFFHQVTRSIRLGDWDGAVLLIRRNPLLSSRYASRIRDMMFSERHGVMFCYGVSDPSRRIGLDRVASELSKHTTPEKPFSTDTDLELERLFGTQGIFFNLTDFRSRDNSLDLGLVIARLRSQFGIRVQESDIPRSPGQQSTVEFKGKRLTLGVLATQFKAESYSLHRQTSAPGDFGKQLGAYLRDAFGIDISPGYVELLRLGSVLFFSRGGKLSNKPPEGKMVDGTFKLSAFQSAGTSDWTWGVSRLNVPVVLHAVLAETPA